MTSYDYFLLLLGDFYLDLLFLLVLEESETLILLSIVSLLVNLFASILFIDRSARILLLFIID